MNIIISFLILGILIFIHELGHFLFAKAVKSPVYKFSIGMGKKLFAKTIGETEYSIRLIPIGGFVQLEQEEDFKSPNGSKFRQLSPIKRGLVYIAGSLFNFILAFILISLISCYTGFPTTTIGKVAENSPARQSELNVGDTIIKVNNTEISSWNDINTIIGENVESKILVTIKRDSKIKDITITPEWNESVGYYILGISPQYETNILKSLEVGLKLTIYNIIDMYKNLIDVFTSIFRSEQNSINQLSGPVGTIQIISSQTKEGFVSSIALIVSLTLSLGVFNLLPIPGLDGGKVLLLIIEAIRGGKKISVKNEIKYTMVGVIALLILMIVTTWNDISTLL